MPRTMDTADPLFFLLASSNHHCTLHYSPPPQCIIREHAHAANEGVVRRQRHGGRRQANGHAGVHVHLAIPRSGEDGRWAGPVRREAGAGAGAGVTDPGCPRRIPNVSLSLDSDKCRLRIAFQTMCLSCAQALDPADVLAAASESYACRRPTPSLDKNRARFAKSSVCFAANGEVAIIGFILDGLMESGLVNE